MNNIIKLLILISVTVLTACATTPPHQPTPQKVEYFFGFNENGDDEIPVFYQNEFNKRYHIEPIVIKQFIPKSTKMKTGKKALAPKGFTEFCKRHPDQC